MRHFLFPSGDEAHSALYERSQEKIETCCHVCILKKGMDILHQIWWILGRILLANGSQNADEGSKMPIDVFDNLRIVSAFLIGGKEDVNWLEDLK